MNGDCCSPNTCDIAPGATAGSCTAPPVTEPPPTCAQTTGSCCATLPVLQRDGRLHRRGLRPAAAALLEASQSLLVERELLQRASSATPWTRASSSCPCTGTACFCEVPAADVPEHGPDLQHGLGRVLHRVLRGEHPREARLLVPRPPTASAQARCSARRIDAPLSSPRRAGGRPRRDPRPGCQDYRFSPVQRCMIQPGSERVSLASTSSADVLFVVDDSGSMAGEQAKLATAFDQFVGSLHAYNDQRADQPPRALRLPHRDHDDVGVLQPADRGDVPGDVRARRATSAARPERLHLHADAHPEDLPDRRRLRRDVQLQDDLRRPRRRGRLLRRQRRDARDDHRRAARRRATTCGQIQNRYAFNREPATCARPASAPPRRTTRARARRTRAATTRAALLRGEGLHARAPSAPPGFGCGNCDGQTNVCCSHARRCTRRAAGASSSPARPASRRRARSTRRASFVGHRHRTRASSTSTSSLYAHRRERRRRVGARLEPTTADEHARGSRARSSSRSSPPT